MSLINEKERSIKRAAQLKDLSETNKALSSVIGFRVSNEELHKLKLEAIKEKRTLSNLIKSKLF